MDVMDGVLDNVLQKLVALDHHYQVRMTMYDQNGKWNAGQMEQ